MIESLLKHCSTAKIFVLCMDENCWKILDAQKNASLQLVRLIDFEDEELLKAKLTRSKTEYYWTCTPSLIRYVINSYSLDDCTYLDADLFFYQSPETALKAMNSYSVLLTDHFYTKEYDQSKKSGRFCVQFMYFKNDSRGLVVLDWWRERCLEWCYARHEDGKFGDQKYLDDWLQRFEGVTVCDNRGYGVAPWNLQQYDLQWLQTNMVFFHFHGVQFVSKDMVRLGSYRFGEEKIANIYIPYLKELLGQYEKIVSFWGHENWLLINRERKTLRKVLARMYHRFKGTDNHVDLRNISHG